MTLPKDFSLQKAVNIHGDLERLTFPALSVPDIPGSRFFTVKSESGIVAYGDKFEIQNKQALQWLSEFPPGFEGIITLICPASFSTFGYSYRDQGSKEYLMELNRELWGDWELHIHPIDYWFGDDLTLFDRHRILTKPDWISLKRQSANVKFFKPTFRIVDNLSHALKSHHTTSFLLDCGTIFKDLSKKYRDKNAALKLDKLYTAKGKIIEIGGDKLTVDSIKHGVFTMPRPENQKVTKNWRQVLEYSYIHQRGNPKPVNPSFSRLN